MKQVLLDLVFSADLSLVYQSFFPFFECVFPLFLTLSTLEKGRDLFGHFLRDRVSFPALVFLGGFEVGRSLHHGEELGLFDYFFDHAVLLFLFTFVS